MLSLPDADALMDDPSRIVASRICRCSGRLSSAVEVLLRPNGGRMEDRNQEQEDYDGQSGKSGDPSDLWSQQILVGKDLSQRGSRRLRGGNLLQALAKPASRGRRTGNRRLQHALAILDKGVHALVET